MIVANAFIPAKINYKSVAILCIYTLVWIYTLTDYLPVSSLPFLLGALTLPFTFTQPKGKISYRFCIASLFFSIVCFLVPVKTNLFLAIAFALLFFIEIFYKRGSFLSAAVLFLMAPAFQYAINVFSFPIRLQLTKWAGQLFAFALDDVYTKGNVIYHHGKEFSVDPACMGLNMLVTSLLISIMLIAYWMKKNQKAIYWPWLLLYCTCILFLNVLGNLFRILIMLQFSIAPADTMHDIAGLICLALYVILPATFLAKNFTNRTGRPIITTTENKRQYPGYRGQVLLLLSIVFCAYRVETSNTYKQFALTTSRIAEYKASEYAPGILKLESNNSLVYVKYVRGFYDTDHNPTICWKGSGYEFQQIEQTNVNGYSIFTAMLVNGNQQLHTAWWYANGKNNTTDQFKWRWDMAKGSKPYAIVNVTASKKDQLYKEVNAIINKKSLAILFQ